ncbi:MAG TPA: hypothetical protein VNI57_01415 [Candidatus Saccharimonadales bacterium]|nr:hypothetical protein [Candidatus Saccharimonadales bacterium]
MADPHVLVKDPRIEAALESASRLAGHLPEAARTHTPEPLNFFMVMNRRLTTFLTECPAFCRLILAQATHISRYARAQKVSFRDIEFTTPRILHNGGVYYEVRARGQFLLNKLDSIHHKAVDV